MLRPRLGARGRGAAGGGGRGAGDRAAVARRAGRPPQNLTTSFLPHLNSDLSSLVVAQQGPPPPNPIVVDRFQQVISQLFTQRIVRLGGPVDDDMANLLVAQLLYLDSASPKKDITMYVNSPGGSVTAGMAVFDTMRHIRPDVSTVCVGLAASMGAFLLASGTAGKRYSLPNARIMIHQPLGGAQGQAADIEIQANEILHHKLTLNGYLAQFTGQGMSRITADTDRDFFMSAAEAVEYGLVDAVVTRPDTAMMVPLTGRQAAARQDAKALADASEAVTRQLAEMAGIADPAARAAAAESIALLPVLRVREVEAEGAAPPKDPKKASKNVLEVPAGRAPDMEAAAEAVRKLFETPAVVDLVTKMNKGAGGPTPVQVRAAASTAAYIAALGFPLTRLKKDSPYPGAILGAVTAAAECAAPGVPGEGKPWKEAKAVELGVYEFCVASERAGRAVPLPALVKQVRAQIKAVEEAKARKAAGKAKAVAGGGGGQEKEGGAEGQEEEEEKEE